MFSSKKYFSFVLLSFFAIGHLAVALEPLAIDEPIFRPKPMEPAFTDDPYEDDPSLEVELSAELMGDNKVVLRWQPYLGKNFLWYKIMHSQENGYPYYPVDDYLDYYEDPHMTEFVHEDVPSGDNYYVICVITTDDRRGCSNAEYIWVEPMPESDNAGKFAAKNPNDTQNFKPIANPAPEITNKPQRRGLFALLFALIKNNFPLFLTIVTVILAASGFTFATRRKRRSISKHMNQIDDTYSEYKMKAKRCEAELYRLKDIIDDELKGGKLEDSAYQLLMNRIEGYMVDIQKQIVNEKFGGLPGSLKKQMFMMMEDGEITEKEMETMQKLIKRSELSVTEKDSLLETIKDFQKQDNVMRKRGKRT